MKKVSSWLVVSLVLVNLLFVAGCSGKEEDPTTAGPAEQIGREIDKAAREAGEQAREMREELGEELEQAGEAMQKPDRPEERGQ